MHIVVFKFKNIAGVVPPISSKSSITSHEKQQQLINDYITNNILQSNNKLVSCQLIACRSKKIINHDKREKTITDTNSNTSFLHLQSWNINLNDGDDDNNNENKAIISKIYYKPSIFSKKIDLSMQLLSLGKVMIVDDILCHRNTTTDNTNEIINYYNSSPTTLEKDGEYMNNLAKIEYDAFLYRRGIWNDNDTRLLRKDLLLEEDDDAKSIWKKIWTYLKNY